MHHPMRLQTIVFMLVAAAFTNIYITQPVLPVLQAEFTADIVTVSYTVAAVILGVAIATLPFGTLVDHMPIKPIILGGGITVSLAGVICATTDTLWVLIGARFVQGLFIPALTTCLAAYLARALPAEKLSVVMGSYVSATVVGGLGGRLLGGWIHPPLDWRYAFVSASILIMTATLIAIKFLPDETTARVKPHKHTNYLALLRRWELMRIYVLASASFFIFSAIFNFLPFRLQAPPFELPTGLVTLLYLVYVMGIFMGPSAGRLSNRYGSGRTLITGVAILGLSIVITLLPTLTAIVIGLVGICAGFFTVHAVAIGLLNRRLNSGQGRANAMYVLFYYIGGWIGITLGGLAYELGNWNGLVQLCMIMLIPLLVVSMMERRLSS